MLKVNKEQTTLVRKASLDILSYLEYIYIYNIEKEEVTKLKQLVFLTGLSSSYKELKVKKSKKNTIYLDLDKQTIYIPKNYESDYSSIRETTILLLIEAFLKRSIDYIVAENINQKYTIFYNLLLSLNVITIEYTNIFQETSIIAQYITDNILKY